MARTERMGKDAQRRADFAARVAAILQEDDDQ
jgi:hypothetical protein